MGKYIKKFDTHSDYEDFIETEDFIRPNVSYCVDNKDVHYNSIQTLFALEIESGRFISFYFQNGVLYANTDDWSSALWVLDGEGVVIDNISYSIADRAPILAQINEHYGTSFTGWSDNEIGLRIGDTIPNWNAYEKIEMPETKQYLAINYDDWTAGYLENENLYLYGHTSSGNIIICSEEGFVYQGGEVLSEEVRMILNSKLQNAGIQFNEIIVIESPYADGETIENWDNYQKIS